MANVRLRLRDGQEELIRRYTEFLPERDLPDRLDFLLMDYARLKEERNRPRRDSNPGIVRSGVLAVSASGIPGVFDRHPAVEEAIHAPAFVS